MIGPNVYHTHWVIGWQSQLHSNGGHAEWKMTIMWLSVCLQTHPARRLRMRSCRTCLWRWPRSGSHLRLHPPLWWCSSRKCRSDRERGVIRIKRAARICGIRAQRHIHSPWRHLPQILVRFMLIAKSVCFIWTYFMARRRGCDVRDTNGKTNCSLADADDYLHHFGADRQWQLHAILHTPQLLWNKSWLFNSCWVFAPLCPILENNANMTNMHRKYEETSS